MVICLRILPQQVPVPRPLSEIVARQSVCGFGKCTLFWSPGERSAVAVGFPCEACQATARRLVMDEKGGWQVLNVPGDIDRGTPASREAQRQAIERGEVELRPVQRRQVFVGGEPVGMPFE